MATQMTIQLVHRIIDIACDAPNTSLLRLTSYQHLIWAIEANRRTSTALTIIRAAYFFNSTITHNRTMSNAMAECYLVSYFHKRCPSTLFL